MKARLLRQIGTLCLQMLCTASACCLCCAASADEADWPSVKKSNPDLYVCVSIIPHLRVPEKFPDDSVISSCSKLISIVEQKHRVNDQRSVNFYYGRAIAYMDTKEWASALRDLNKALQLLPNDEEFLQARQTVSKQLGETRDPPQAGNNSRQIIADMAGPGSSVPAATSMKAPALSEINRELQDIDRRDQTDPYVIGMKARNLQLRGELYIKEGYYRYALEDLTWAQQAWQQYGDKSARAQGVQNEVANDIKEAQANLSHDRKSYRVESTDFVTFICEPAGDRISIDRTRACSHFGTCIDHGGADGVGHRRRETMQVLTDAQWAKFEAAIAAAKIRGARPRTEERRTIEAIIWRLDNGAKWRSVPPELGDWHHAYLRFRRWAVRGVWDRIMAHVVAQGEPQLAFACVDGTVARAHQKASGARAGKAAR